MPVHRLPAGYAVMRYMTSGSIIKEVIKSPFLTRGTLKKKFYSIFHFLESGIIPEGYPEPKHDCLQPVITDDA